ncbi:LacI family DNA-binding transcriptional regulator [Klebsiella sp. NPDC088457]
MKNKLLIKDVAKMAGVSTATISRFLNGKYHSMSEATRHHIASTIEKIGYQPNNIARSLRSQQSKTIAVIMADIFNPYSMDVLRGIEEFCSLEGYKIFICDAKNSGSRERNYIEEMISRGVDGIIINTTGENDLFIKGVSLEHPVVLIGRKIKGSNISSVVADNAQGIQLALEHLLNTGCRRVSYLTPAPGNVSPRIERIENFATFSALRAFSHITFECIRFERVDREHVLNVMQKLVVNSTKDHAIITGNGQLSLFVVQAARALGKSIPEDFSLIGFDETEWSEILKNPLTVVAQPTYEIGCTAAKNIIKTLRNEHGNDDPTTTLLPFSLIVRDTA